MTEFVSRAGQKLQHALTSFKINPQNLICADFGSSTGGFVDCLIQSGAKKVYSVDTAYGELAWKLRNNEKVVPIERTNALHVILPEKVDLITIDTGWTKQKDILPNAIKNLKEDGTIITLVKPHYEAEKSMLEKGLLPEEKQKEVLEKVQNDIKNLNLNTEMIEKSPIEGKRAGNTEYLFLLKSWRTA